MNETAAQFYSDFLRTLPEGELENEHYTMERQPQFAGNHDLTAEERLSLVHDEINQRNYERFYSNPTTY